jgi:aspartate/methionine/tyrosine aminotransferase
VVNRFREDAPGIEFVEPHGAFYFFFRVDGLGSDPTLTGTSFCERLLRNEGVALVAGGAFGDDRWVRLSYAVSDKELDSALDRIIRFIGSLGD